MKKKELIEKVNRLEDKLNKVVAGINDKTHQEMNLYAPITQLRCGVKGHNFVFNKSDSGGINGWHILYSGHHVPSYIFKCSKCGLTITKTKKELTVKEKNALKTLGIL